MVDEKQTFILFFFKKLVQAQEAATRWLLLNDTANFQEISTGTGGSNKEEVVVVERGYCEGKKTNYVHGCKEYCGIKY